MRFLRTGKITHRARARELYAAAVEAEPHYRLGHYNLGNLPYNRYTEDDNAKAIERFRAAAESPDGRLRALARCVSRKPSSCRRSGLRPSHSAPSATR
jgi:hypothetical protein